MFFEYTIAKKTKKYLPKLVSTFFMVRPKTSRKQNSPVNCFVGESPFQMRQEEQSRICCRIAKKIKKYLPKLVSTFFMVRPKTSRKQNSPVNCFVGESPFQMRQEEQSRICCGIVKKTKKHLPKLVSTFFMVRPKGLEPLTYWFVASHSIQLSYERVRVL